MINPPSQAILEGTYETIYEVTKEHGAWFRAVKQTEQEKGTMKVLGIITNEQYQETFNLAKKNIIISGRATLHGMEGHGRVRLSRGVRMCYAAHPVYIWICLQTMLERNRCYD